MNSATKQKRKSGPSDGPGKKTATGSRQKNPWFSATETWTSTTSEAESEEEEEEEESELSEGDLPWPTDEQKENQAPSTSKLSDTEEYEETENAKEEQQVPSTQNQQLKKSKSSINDEDEETQEGDKEKESNQQATSSKSKQSSDSTKSQGLKTELEKLCGKLDFCNKKKAKKGKKPKGQEDCEIDSVLAAILTKALDPSVNPFSYNFLKRKGLFNNLLAPKYNSEYHEKQNDKAISKQVAKIPTEYIRHSDYYDEILDTIFSQYIDELDVDSTVVEEFNAKREEFRRLKNECLVYKKIKLKEIPSFDYMVCAEPLVRDRIENVHPNKKDYDTYITKARNKSIEDIKHFHLFNYGDKGLGVRASRVIPQAALIGEYGGKLMPHDDILLEKGDINYSMIYSKTHKLSVNAQSSGNLTRIINHSCSPNCNVAYYNYKGNRTIIIATKCQVDEGSELTIDYGLSYKMKKCLCNSKNCRYKN